MLDALKLHDVARPGFVMRRLVCDYRNCSCRLPVPPHDSQITRHVFLDGPRYGDHAYDEGGAKARRSGPRDNLFLNEVQCTWF